MNAAAKAVVSDLPEIVIAYGVSDEYRFVVLPCICNRIPEAKGFLSFVFHKTAQIFQRRSRQVAGTIPSPLPTNHDAWLILRSKLVSTVVSTFTANYIHQWSTYFPEAPLPAPPGASPSSPSSPPSPPLPSFDGRAVCYPSVESLRDYLSWRQADC